MGIRKVNRPIVAGAVLLAAYLALSLFTNDDGYLGTDTGGKVATLDIMVERGSLDPDIGYWAEEWDPDGSLHPLYFTAHIGSRWVTISTLPAMHLAMPLYDVAGYRGALLLPMFGAVAAAFAAREIARRTAGGTGWLAYWLCGLASPVAIYALDFWEHTLGLALMAWAVVAFMSVADSTGVKRIAALAGCAGLAFGVASTMRTEALVYAFAATACTCLVLLWRRRTIILPVVAGVTATVGLLLPIWLNSRLELAVMETASRTSRAAGTVAIASDAGSSRSADAAVTGLSLHPVATGGSYVIGLAVLGLLLFVAGRARNPAGDQGPAVLAFCALVLLYAVRLMGGLGFVPGLVASTPIAAFALVIGWRMPKARLPMVIVLGALPLVWAFQYTDGSLPQWGGRYILLSGLVLGAIGAGSLEQVRRWARLGVIGLAVSITSMGMLWLVARSHDVARTGEMLTRRPEAVVVSEVAHLGRELGSFYLDKRWLTAITLEEQIRAGEIVHEAGLSDFALVRRHPAGRPPELAGFRSTGTELIPFIAGLQLAVTGYQATD